MFILIKRMYLLFFYFPVAVDIMPKKKKSNAKHVRKIHVLRKRNCQNVGNTEDTNFPSISKHYYYILGLKIVV